mgnify:CR=1 FL=1
MKERLVKQKVSFKEKDGGKAGDESVAKEEYDSSRPVHLVVLCEKFFT